MDCWAITGIPGIWKSGGPDKAHFGHARDMSTDFYTTEVEQLTWPKPSRSKQRCQGPGMCVPSTKIFAGSVGFLSSFAAMAKRTHVGSNPMYLHKGQYTCLATCAVYFQGDILPCLVTRVKLR